jgi:hypothetical protein
MNSTSAQQLQAGRRILPSVVGVPSHSLASTTFSVRRSPASSSSVAHWACARPSARCPSTRPRARAPIIRFEREGRQDSVGGCHRAARHRVTSPDPPRTLHERAREQYSELFRSQFAPLSRPSSYRQKGAKRECALPRPRSSRCARATRPHGQTSLGPQTPGGS